MRAILAIMAAAALLAAEPAEVAAPDIKATVTPKQATVGSVLDYKININGRGLSKLSIVPPEKREFYLEPKDAKPKQAETAAPAEGQGGEQADADKGRPVEVRAPLHHPFDEEGRPLRQVHDRYHRHHAAVILSSRHPGVSPTWTSRGRTAISIGYQAPSVEIRAVNEKGEFQDIEPPLKLSGNYWRLAFLVLGLIAFGAAAFFIGRRALELYRERKNAPVIIPPIVTFMDEIHRFGGDRLIDEGKIDEFVFGISMLFRSYLSAQFTFDATDMTTYEIERKIKKVFPRSLYDACAAEIMRNFNLWDLSKFAEFAPTKKTSSTPASRTRYGWPGPFQETRQMSHLEFKDPLLLLLLVPWALALAWYLFRRLYKPRGRGRDLVRAGRCACAAPFDRKRTASSPAPPLRSHAASHYCRRAAGKGGRLLEHQEPGRGHHDRHGRVPVHARGGLPAEEPAGRVQAGHRGLRCAPEERPAGHGDIRGRGVPPVPADARARDDQRPHRRGRLRFDPRRRHGHRRRHRPGCGAHDGQQGEEPPSSSW